MECGADVQGQEHESPEYGLSFLAAAGKWQRGNKQDTVQHGAKDT